MKKPIINIGLLSHVDAGKTTLTENFLYLSGAIRQKGNVDKGTTITDSMEIERKRGISVKSSAVFFEWNNVHINLIDTPGHVDFSAEVERILQVLDGAIIIVSALEGIQAHTITLIEILKDLSIPFIIFINKIDRDGVDFDLVLNSFKEELDIDILPITLPNEQLDIISFWETDVFNKTTLYENIMESIIELDDDLMSEFIEDKLISKQKLWQSALNSIKTKKLVPVLSGIAKNGIGIEALLNSITNFLPKAPQKIDASSSALVYKIEHHTKYGKLAYVRIFTGQLSAKESIINNRIHTEVKLGTLKINTLNKLNDTPALKAGEIGIITGLDDIQSGDILGDNSTISITAPIFEPVISTIIKPIDNKDSNELNEALSILNIEDPLLNLKWYKNDNEFHISIVGPIQIEILEEQLLNRFGLKVIFEPPTIIYKERPLKSAKGFVRYWMPKPCWAIMTFLVEPGELGSGILFKSNVRQSDIHQKYQNEVKRTIPKVLKQGIKGWEVTDLKITLIEGEDHNIHSRPGDFELATYMGLMRALDNSETELLEPILDFNIKAPEQHLGKIASDLTRMRAIFANPYFDNDIFILNGTIPAATSIDYSIRLNSLTSGRGRIRMKFKNYNICPPNSGTIRKYKGVNPLDESKWILHRRGAYTLTT